MKTSFIIVACLLHAAVVAPQLITFKDGKVGVNFLGYHAEAGLGGGPNSQGGLLGGLHASAGTPWGQNAAAGLGGDVNGRAAGILYAGAQAMPDVGAGVVLGGDTSRGGYGGAEAYVPGKIASRQHTIVAGNRHQYDVAPPVPDQEATPATEGPNAIQKIKPPKKYRGDEAPNFKFAHDNDFVQLSTDKDHSIAKNVQQKPASIVVTKTINKTTFSTPSRIATRGVHKFHSVAVEPSSSSSLSSLSSPSASLSPVVTHNQATLDNHNESHNLRVVAQTSNPTATYDSFAAASPSIIIPPSSASATLSSSASLTHLNEEDNYNRNLNDKSSSVVIRQQTRTKLRNRPNRAQRQQRKLQQRLSLNQERQRTKTIIRTVEEVDSAEQQQHDQGLVIVDEQQAYPQISVQQHIRKSVEKRQLIAPIGTDQADSQSQQNSGFGAAGGIVHSALQIPVGILQSLQQSLRGLP